MILYRYFNNPFNSVTRSSYKRMNLLATDHAVVFIVHNAESKEGAFFVKK